MFRFLSRSKPDAVHAPSVQTLAPLTQVYASRGIILSDGKHQGQAAFFLQGATFPLKSLIKGHGGRWEGNAQRWRLASLEAVAAIAANLEEIDEGGNEPRDGSPMALSGLAEEAPNFERHGTKHYHGHRERLRQRFMEAGADALADYELLELLLFFSVWRRDTKPLAKAMLARFGGLGGVLAADPRRYEELVRGDLPSDSPAAAKRDEDLFFTQVLLRTIRSIHEKVLKEAVMERPVISSWTALIDYLNAILAHETSEQFRILFLDRKNILIRDEIQSRGTVDHTPLYPREVVKRALELAASAIIMVHNHPSGDTTPSEPDILMTQQVVEALKPVGIAVHDHVIIGKNGHTSFKSHRLI